MTITTRERFEAAFNIAHSQMVHIGNGSVKRRDCEVCKQSRIDNPKGYYKTFLNEQKCYWNNDMFEDVLSFIESECQRREEEVREKANEIFRWLKGAGPIGEEWFPAKQEGDHPFYWRKRLREKIEEGWERLFDKRFGMLKYVTQDEIDGVFVLEKDRRMVKSFIREHFIPKERVEKLKKEVNHCKCKARICEIHTLSRTVAHEFLGYNQALDDVLSLLSEDKE